jgi:hypothetical protein
VALGGDVGNRRLGKLVLSEKGPLDVAQPRAWRGGVARTGAEAFLSFHAPTLSLASRSLSLRNSDGSAGAFSGIEPGEPSFT